MEGDIPRREFHGSKAYFGGVKVALVCVLIGATG
jgi:hypothetical protein